MYYFMFRLFEENQDAFLALPTEVKTILAITLALWLGSSILRKAGRMIKYAVLAVIIYFACTYFGIF